MEAVRRLTSRFGAAVPVLLLATGGVETQTPSSVSSESGSSDMPVMKKNYWRFSSVAAAESHSSQEPPKELFRMSKPNIVKAGDPVLHERASEVDLSEIKSQKVQKIIDYMIQIMRNNSPPAFGLSPNASEYSLSAPQIGIPSRIIVLEYKKEWLSSDTVENININDIRPFDLLVIVNPKLKKKSYETALAIETCVSVGEYAAVVERNLHVEVTGFDRYGEPIKINASGWQARILQHTCDHLDGTLYVDKMVPRTFRTKRNLNMPLVDGSPTLGPRR